MVRIGRAELLRSLILVRLSFPGIDALVSSNTCLLGRMLLGRIQFQVDIEWQGQSVLHDSGCCFSRLMKASTCVCVACMRQLARASERFEYVSSWVSLEHVSLMRSPYVSPAVWECGSMTPAWY